ncbi:MAG TPA: mechanosensitive ion channel protein MscS [Methylophilaceae bacterium]|nr:mechanosensitive ion channel protein MscS [Methylophilaceae bacterium]
MNTEIQQIWQEVLADYSSPVALWQLLIIVGAVGLSLLLNGAIRAYLLKNASDQLKPLLGGINRVLFPITTFLFVGFARLGLDHWGVHVGILRFACRLLLAMAAIRLIVYALRYIFSPSGWLKALEHVIAWAIWGMLALHLSGFLSQIVQVLEDVQFNVGKNSVNLLIILQGILTVIFTIFIALWLSRLLENKLMRANEVSLNMRVVLVKLVRIVFIFVAVLIALSAVGLDITLLSVFGGALGVGLGFGLQKVASNYVSGFIILLDKSMSIGDVVTIGSHNGVVKDMRSRYTTLKKLDGTEVIIPNEMMITEVVINHTSAEHKVRVQMPIQISYDSDIDVAISIMKDVTLKHQRTLTENENNIDVFIKGFGESGIDLMLSFWIADPEQGSAALQSELYYQIWVEFKNKNIVIPYPQREIRLLGKSELSM